MWFKSHMLMNINFKKQMYTNKQHVLKLNDSKRRANSLKSVCDDQFVHAIF